MDTSPLSPLGCSHQLYHKDFVLLQLERSYGICCRIFISRKFTNSAVVMVDVTLSKGLILRNLLTVI